MFEPQSHPRVLALPPGVDFPAELIAGLVQRMQGQPPEAMGRVQVIVNAARMRRRIQLLFQRQAPTLLPRVALLTEIGIAGQTDPLQSPLRRKLELGKLVAGLIASDPTLAPGSAVFDLAESLMRLMDEMRGEDVSPETIAGLDVSDESGHWARSLKFISLIQCNFTEDMGLDSEARQRIAIEGLIARWVATPPRHPIILAGSTGSRGTTALLMAAIARLPQGAVVLPGFDFEMSKDVWERLRDPMSSEDHPQYRFARLMTSLELPPDQISRWSGSDPRRDRNRFISLALRPAPVTDQWVTEGPGLKDLVAATAEMTLIEAPNPRTEALAIAICLRQAAEDGRTAALVTPDRVLTRQVTAALDRWSLVPDDSAGRPLHLSAPGRFLRHVAGLLGERLTAQTLLILLKHPLCNTGGHDRGAHLRQTQELELWLRRKGPAFLKADTIREWARMRADPESLLWADWLSKSLHDVAGIGRQPVAVFLQHHIDMAERLSAGPNDDPGELWFKDAGVEALRRIDDLRAQAGFGGIIEPRDYRALFLSEITGEVREPVQAHPRIMIWGTLEARVQGADLVILGGLNDGVWPELPGSDPWLNRRMRQQAGLLVPERRVGLSAHDFQQAIAASEVVMTRSIRDMDSETVVSRWLNRICNLLAGLESNGGPESLAHMRRRGQYWLDLARTVEADFEPVAPANRPAPCPPVNMRPQQLSVTQIKTLIRDPYAVYARNVLGLRALDPLRQDPDAPLRGTVLHRIFERFIHGCDDPRDPAARNLLLTIADETLAEMVPWPTTRRIWKAKLTRVSDWFIDGEIERRKRGEPIRSMLEGTGSLNLHGMEFVLTGKADRIDRLRDGTLAIYDYKTGPPPSVREMKYFDKQLLLEAAMAEAGGFRGLAPSPVSEIAYIGMGTSPTYNGFALRDPDAKEVLDPDKTIGELRVLIERYMDRELGYASRRAMHKSYNTGDYDHLARYGEWDDSQPPVPEHVG